MKNIYPLLFFITFITSCAHRNFHSHELPDTQAKKVNQTLQNMTDSKDKLPYFQIPDAPTDFKPGSVISRTIDGLGFRFYWATEDLTKENLSYKPSEKGRTIFETSEHIHSLTKLILNVPKNKPNIRPSNHPELTFEEMRAEILQDLKTASDLFRGKSEKEISEMEIVFQRAEKSSEYPLWNLLNGPLADAIWHTGQIVMMRRSAGNPFPEGVSVFNGIRREK